MWGNDRSRNSSRPELEELEPRVVPTLQGQQLFPLDNAWNQQITDAPVAANSDQVIANIGSSISLFNDFYENPQVPSDPDDPLYGIPINIVDSSLSGFLFTDVHITDYYDESDITTLPKIASVPIVSNMVIEGDKVGGVRDTPVGDSHLIIWDKATNIAYELYRATRPSETPFGDDSATHDDDGFWHAIQITIWDMNSNEFFNSNRQIGWTSADAAGLSILAGLARPDEGTPVIDGGQGVIEHALRFTLENNKVLGKFIYPASHEANSGTDASVLVPMGSRFRLKASVDIDGLNPQSKIIAQALKDYGLMLADNGSSMYINGASSVYDPYTFEYWTWSNADLLDATNGIHSLQASDFELVDLKPHIDSLSQTIAPAGTTITVNGYNFSGAAGFLDVLFDGTPGTNLNVLSDTQISVTAPAGAGTVDVVVRSGRVGLTGDDADNVNFPVFGYGDSNSTSFTFGLPPGPLADALAANQDFTIIGATGSPTQILAVKIFDGSGNLVSTVTPFNNLTSLRVAAGDFDGDGRADEFAVLGRRTNTDLRAEIVTYDLDASGQATETGRFDGFAPGIFGNGFITAGDFDGDGDDDLAVAQIGGGRTFATLQVHTSTGGNFAMAGMTTIDYGVVSAPRVGAGDSDADGFDEIVVGVRTPAGARIFVFDADAGTPAQQGNGFFWDFGSAGYGRGAFVDIGEFDPTSPGEEIILGSNVGGGGRVDVVSYDGVGAAALVENGRLTPFGAGYNAAVRVAVGQLNDRNVLIAGQDRFQAGQYTILARQVDTGQANPAFENIPAITALAAGDGLAPTGAPDGNRTLGPFVTFANLTPLNAATRLLAPSLPDDIELALAVELDRRQLVHDQVDELFAAM